MRIAVGSENPVKREATERATAALNATVATEAVDSGVSEQPMTDAETRKGARNRAERALAAGDYDLGVGLEGGVTSLDDDLLLTMWAAVTDGETVGVGGGPRLLLPDEIAERVRAGEELGPVMDDVVGAENVARANGAAGVLTGDLVNRESALRHALAGALGPFVTDYY
ncbi:inosine/xanthosine triphosphatase [Salarchaeum japonicum]|uniref:inosine/xanthosine triphosphatase n=1 Tax=Salarchaeum japonicum TaxID=555573 RepID=UPI003C7746ED